MGILEDLIGRAGPDLDKCIDVLKEGRKRFLSKCATCGDTGSVMTSRGEVRCHCPKGRDVECPEKK